MILRENEIDIIGLSETRLDSTVTDRKVCIVGYRIFRNDRDADGGGVPIYVKSSFPEPKMKLKSVNFELLSVEISTECAKPFLLVRWYRPPATDVDEEEFEN